ncbi:glycosyl transferase family 1 [Mycobacterium shigaense]|nr:glycosyl transferase family 1 [Mycobacterium shigaense]
MKFVLASYGSRGDIEPCVALGRELLSRGHDVCMAAPPDLVEFAQLTVPTVVAFGPDSRSTMNAHRDFWTAFFANFWKIRRLIRLRRETVLPALQRWDHICATLASLTDGADLLVTGVNFEQAAVNVADYHDIPLVTLHHFPLRSNGQLISALPPRLSRAAMKVYEWVAWRLSSKLERAQRRDLGLPKARGPLSRRFTERGSLEIQAYDAVCFPGLAAEWAHGDWQRPFVGALTLELPTDADDEVMSWIAAGSPPIFFGFGSMPIKSPADAFDMISAACAQLGARALICSAATDFGDVAHADHVQVVDTVNYATTFPYCRAVVHHGGTGTTAASLRAGVPTLILSTDIDQKIWGARVTRLKVGATRSLSSVTEKTLIADLRTVLAPEYATRAREIAAQMTRPAASPLAAADLVEGLARRSSVPESANEPSGAMPDHHDGRVRAPAGDLGQHGAVDHPQVLEPADPTPRIDDGVRIPVGTHRGAGAKVLRGGPYR